MIKPLKKKHLFYLIMFALPIVVLIESSIIYMGIKSHSDQVASFEKELLTRIEDDTIDKSEYVDNWKAVNIMFPVPYTVLHYNTNIRGDAVNTNDLGFRETLNYLEMVNLAKTVHKGGGKVVVIIGGSAAFGAYSRNDATCIVGYLNRLAQKAETRIVVFNFAMGLYTSDQELVSLVMYDADLEPELLIVIDGYNDLLRVTHEGYTLGAKIPYAYAQLRHDLYNMVRFPTSVFLDRRYNVNGDEKELEEVLDVYCNNLSKMCHFMKAYDKKTILSTQPLMGYRNACMGSKPDFIKRVHRIYGRLIRTARAVAEQCSAVYVDLVGVFEGRMILVGFSQTMSI